jgi:hypothetical protein
VETPCHDCGLRLAQRDVLYSTSGDPQCAICHGKADLIAIDQRAAANIVKAGRGALIASVLGFFGKAALLGILSYMFVAMAAISGIFALSSLGSGNERFARHLTSRERSVTTVLAIVALVIAALTVFGVPLQLFH